MSAKNELAVTNARDAVTAAYQAVSTLQDFKPAQQVAGVSILFHIIAEQLGLSPSELLNKAERMTADADTYYSREVKALRDYVRGELG